MALLAGTWIGLFLVCLTTVGGLAIYRVYAKEHKLFDIPNSRSLNDRKLVVGAGVIIIGIQALAWAIGLTSAGPEFLLPIVIAVALMLLSFRDDIQPLSPQTRLAAHFLAAGVLAVLFPIPFLTQHGIPLWVSIGVLTVAIAWFINLYNFMDGIDGITGMQTIVLGTGFLVITHIANIETPLTSCALWLIGGAAMFLFWNWHPARMILGDAGSIPLGFLTAWLMIELARNGQIASAIILPLYYLFDATATLSVRVGSGRRFWRPHREHAYQRAVLAGVSHARVVAIIAVFNILLLGLAVYSIHQPVIAVLTAIFATALFWRALPRLAPGRQSSESDHHNAS